MGRKRGAKLRAELQFQFPPNTIWTNTVGALKVFYEPNPVDALSFSCRAASCRGPQSGRRCPIEITSEEHGEKLHRYWLWSSDCGSCKLKAQCTPALERKIVRWEHGEVLEPMQKRLDTLPMASQWRRETAEHVFGALKSWMGSAHFLTKRLRNVRTEMSLQVLAYNMERALQIVGGVPVLLQAMRAEKAFARLHFVAQNRATTWDRPNDSQRVSTRS